MSEVRVRDISRAGHHLGGAVVADLPAEVSFGDLLRTRVTAEVEAYNRSPSDVFVGLVQPADAIRHSDGHRMSVPRRLDAEAMVAAALEAVEAGLVTLRVGDVSTQHLDDTFRPADHDEVVLVLGRSIVARHG